LTGYLHSSLTRTTPTYCEWFGSLGA
jgi:hypothetical protein